MNLPYFVGSIEKFEAVGINTNDLKKNEGSAIIHIENLTIDQFNELRLDVEVFALSHEQARELWGDV